MTPIVYNFVVYQGAVFNPTLNCVSGENGVPINFTGYTAQMMGRLTYSSIIPFFNLTTENGGITLNSTGKIELYISSEETELLIDNGVYDLKLIPPSGEENAIRLLMGAITISLEVTT